MNRLWVRILTYAIMACMVTALAIPVSGFLPYWMANLFGVDAVLPVLTILASSMLAVSTFSLNVMVSAHRSAASNATPRIHRLLLDDSTTQEVLATFIGAFVFALTTIILFQTGLFTDGTAVVAMMATIVIVVMVIFALLRWINHLSSLGSMDNSMNLAFERAQNSLLERRRHPALGANRITADTVAPDQTVTVNAPKTGSIQLIDIEKLHDCAGEDGLVYVLFCPGRHVFKGQPLFQVSGPVSDSVLQEMACAFTIDNFRSHEQDPRFGLEILSEISSRALSPGINDPGTAIEVVTKLGSLLWDYASSDIAQAPVTACRVFISVPDETELMRSAFAATARDGAGTIEVALALKNTLERLENAPHPELADAANQLGTYARAHANAALELPLDREIYGLKEK